MLENISSLPSSSSHTNPTQVSDQSVTTAPSKQGDLAQQISIALSYSAMLGQMTTQDNVKEQAQAESSSLDQVIKGLTEPVGTLVTLVSGFIEKLTAQPAVASQVEQAVEQANAPRDLKASGEFLWKPSSDKDGKLAILLPERHTGKVKNVKILSPDGKQLATGKYSGVGNGDREHFRFSKSGEKFPDGSQVVITMKDGATRKVTIKETSERLVK